MCACAHRVLRAAHAPGLGCHVYVGSFRLHAVCCFSHVCLAGSIASLHTHQLGWLARRPRVARCTMPSVPACASAWPQHALPAWPHHTLPSLPCARLPGCRRLTRSCRRTTSWWSEQQHPQQAEQSQWHTQPAAHAARAAAACTRWANAWVQPFFSMCCKHSTAQMHASLPPALPLFLPAPPSLPPAAHGHRAPWVSRCTPEGAWRGRA